VLKQYKRWVLISWVFIPGNLLKNGKSDEERENCRRAGKLLKSGKAVEEHEIWWRTGKPWFMKEGKPMKSGKA